MRVERASRPPPAALRSHVASARKPKDSGDDVAALSFETALERLEAIVERIEAGEVSLEEAIQEYEQGMTLIRRCKDVLARAEQRVEELSKAALDGGGDARTDGERR